MALIKEQSKSVKRRELETGVQ